MMKTSYRQSSVRARSLRQTRWLLVGVTAVLAILIFGGSWFARGLAPLGLGLARPLWRAEAAALAHFRGAGEWWRSRTKLARENQSLRAALAWREAELLDHEALATENQKLREELGWRAETPDDFLVGRVISHPWSTPYDLLLIDVGEAGPDAASPPGRAPRVGDLVTYRRDLALGRVVGVTGTTVKVGLFSVGQNQLPVVIGAARLPAAADGRGGGNFLIQLPRAAAVAAGEPVFLATAERDYLVGRVGAVEKTPTESLQNIFVRLPLNPNQLTYVEIESRTD